MRIRLLLLAFAMLPSDLAAQGPGARALAGCYALSIVLSDSSVVARGRIELTLKPVESPSPLYEAFEARHIGPDAFIELAPSVLATWTTAVDSTRRFVFNQYDPLWGVSVRLDPIDSGWAGPIHILTDVLTRPDTTRPSRTLRLYPSACTPSAPTGAT